MGFKFFQNIIEIFRGRKFINFHGKNNKIIIPDKCKFNLLYLFALTNIKMSGDNNTVIFRGNFSVKNYLNILFGLRLKIVGNDNLVDIEFPIYFRRVEIALSRDKNIFKIKATSHKARDTRFEISDGGTVDIGREFQFGNGNLYVVVGQDFHKKHSLLIGDNVFVARDVIIRTCDGHTIIDPKTKEALNEPEDVIIGNNVWITSRCTILKGSQISDNSIVAACALVNKKFTEENVIIAGVPAKIIKRDIAWDPKHFDVYMRDRE